MIWKKSRFYHFLIMKKNCINHTKNIIKKSKQREANANVVFIN